MVLLRVNAVSWKREGQSKAQMERRMAIEG